ncbi:MAG TPA: sodium-dependent transporter [Paenibacillaceae bacterium]
MGRKNGGGSHENRPQFGSRIGFIMAAAGSAIGLGNIWRFPAVAYENGGGAMFIPYLVALMTAGIPLLIMEIAIGHKHRASPPVAFGRMRRGFVPLGWWHVIVTFFITMYYSTVIAWALSYVWFSLNLGWGDKPEAFFHGYLQLADAPGQIGGLVPGVVIPLAIVWLGVLIVVHRGVKKGIERAAKIMMPMLCVLFAVLVVRALTLEGAAEGLNAFFKPNWDMIRDSKVWVAAYTQIFFSLSLAHAIMICYGSYLDRKEDVAGNAFIVGFANSGFELLAGIGVFAALGFMAVQQGVGVHDVVSGGTGLAFVAFPQIINQLPALNELFGVLFFMSLVLAGVTSMIGQVESIVQGLQEKFRITRGMAVLFGGGLTMLASLLFATRDGRHLVNVVDYFVNSYGVTLIGLAEVIAVAWIEKRLRELQDHINAVSGIRIGAWWRTCLGIITPFVLGYMAIDSIRANLVETYGGYDAWFVGVFGWGAAAAALAISVIFAAIPDRKPEIRTAESAEVSS